MFKVVAIDGNKYDIIDTADNVIERYTLKEANKIASRGIKIQGLPTDDENMYKSGSVNGVVHFRCPFENGFEQLLGSTNKCDIPVMLRLPNGKFKQVIYIDKHIDDSFNGIANIRYRFYDGTLFDLSSKFISNHQNELAIDTMHNDPTALAGLLQRLREESR